jgi:O-antigen ligase
MGAPLAFALYETRRSLLRLLILLGTLGLVAACVVMSQSRSGQLTFAAMLGIYFVRRFGLKGAVAAAVAMAPVLLFGGRSGDEAKESTEERLGCWAEGLNMWRGSPIIGVGNGQFTEHHYLTAHSSIVLTLAEMGPLGLFLWTAVIYFAFKITIRIQLQFATQPEAAPARTWSLAILASLTGMLVSAAFLSIPYHSILWIYVALSGAVYGTVRAHEPDFRVRFGWRDFALVGAIDTVTVGFIAVYVRMKGAG